MQKIHVTDLGMIRYEEALPIQQKHFDHLIQNKQEGRMNTDAHVLFLCEHEPVITLGKAANRDNLLLSEEFLKEKNITVFPAGRGGDVTFHGPGQLVGYPVLDLDLFTSDLKKYMRMLEEVIIRTLASYGMEGYRIEGETGVWVKSEKNNLPRKICAFGVKTSRWVTMHGFALNVNVALEPFNYIVPCGISDKGVTSIVNERPTLSDEISMDEVKRLIIDNFAKVFNSTINFPS